MSPSQRSRGHVLNCSTALRGIRIPSYSRGALNALHEAVLALSEVGVFKHTSLDAQRRQSEGNTG